MLFSWLYRPETTGALEKLYSQPHQQNCQACAELFKNLSLSNDEQAALATTHRCLFNLWPHIAPHLQSLRQIKRWNQVNDRKFHQTSYDHSLTLPVLAAFIFGDTQGMTPADVSYGVIRASIHDIGEGTTGDVLYPVKKHILIKDLYPEIEDEITRKVLLAIEGLGEELWRVYAEDLTPRANIFSAVESVDYILYSYEELEAGCQNKDNISNIFGNGLEALDGMVFNSRAVAKLLAERMNKMNSLRQAYPIQTTKYFFKEEVTSRYLELILNTCNRLLKTYADNHASQLPPEIQRQLLALYRGFNHA